jgi:hypothetical protein
VNVTVESTAKALGPALGGALYAFSIARKMPAHWPNASIVYFSGFATLLGLFCVGATMLPRSIDHTAAADDVDTVSRSARATSASETAIEMRPAATPDDADRQDVQNGSLVRSTLRPKIKMHWLPQHGAQNRFKRLSE